MAINAWLPLPALVWLLYITLSACYLFSVLSTDLVKVLGIKKEQKNEASILPPLITKLLSWHLASIELVFCLWLCLVGKRQKSSERMFEGVLIGQKLFYAGKRICFGWRWAYTYFLGVMVKWWLDAGCFLMWGLMMRRCMAVRNSTHS